MHASFTGKGLGRLGGKLHLHRCRDRRGTGATVQSPNYGSLPATAGHRVLPAADATVQSPNYGGLPAPISNTKPAT